ncbi:DUF4252 domain-containing protein [Paludibacter sp. 221]|uniref:DUF4252 domain-containing protein n=1 Tax=Paludibacter sp. 221 TaxID=2302939 RepID=UPI0013D3E789|nr:DUF4252 domain-containing protein [Paludibacter sp. 221]NDV47825.1 DUF4252 domain-containing protein [Paludibacter sp. 221]
MKKTMILAAFLILVAATANAQTLKSLFDKYGNDERFEYVSIGKGMLTMAQLFGDTDDEDMEVLSKIKGLKVLTLTDGFDDTLQKTVLEELNTVLEAGNFETLVEVRDKDERVNIYTQTSKKDETDMLVVTKDSSELNMIWIKGKLSAEELMTMLDD